MKKFTIFLLFDIFLFSLSACNKKSADTDTSSVNESSVVQKLEDDEAGAQPYYFSDNLKRAISNCTLYSEDIFEKNPDMKEFSSMLPGDIDLSQAKMILTVQGKKEDKCQITIKYDFPFPMSPELQCALSPEEQKKLVNAMNDKSTEEKTKTFKTDDFSMTITGLEFDLIFSEITNSSCQLVEHEPTAY